MKMKKNILDECKGIFLVACVVYSWDHGITFCETSLKSKILVDLDPLKSELHRSRLVNVKRYILVKQ